jgi:ADP-L-glycero-D-manno-heptose 6-epimerase
MVQRGPKLLTQENMTILVTGSRGFVGKNILFAADKRGVKTYDIDDQYFNDPSPESHLIDFLNQINPDAILHVGACSDTLNSNVNFMMERNYLSTKWLVDWCRKNEKKIVYSSSASVYGACGNGPSNLYGWSKMCGEDYVVTNGGIALRYFNVYGPGECHKGRMASMMRQNFNKKEVDLFPKKPKRDFVFIEDVVDANFYALDNYDNLKGKWYEVGSGQSVEFETIFDALGIKYKYKNESDIPQGYQLNTLSSRERYMPGWTPRVGISEGMQKYMNHMDKVSFVCTTFGRFACVERLVAQYHAQTYQNKELIIFNTDEEHPYSLEFEDPSIIIVNNGIDYKTGEPYRNRGQICRDAVTHASGFYFMLADDDDIYLPWHMEQAVDGIKSNGKDAWKPEKSFFATRDKLMLASNTMEASIIVKMERIREIGFRSDLTGYEGLSWYTKMRDEGNLDEHNKKYIPSYCFNWGDPPEMAGHKQSGSINDPNNFENHKRQSTDFAFRPLRKLSAEEIYNTYQKFYDWLTEHRNEVDVEHFEKYFNA